MELTHMFYEELPIDEDNIFKIFLQKFEQVVFNKSKKYAISSLFINQDTTAYIPLRNVQGQKALSHILQTYSEGKKV